MRVKKSTNMHNEHEAFIMKNGFKRNGEWWCRLKRRPKEILLLLLLLLKHNNEWIPVCIQHSSSSVFFFIFFFCCTYVVAFIVIVWLWFIVKNVLLDIHCMTVELAELFLLVLILKVFLNLPCKAVAAVFNLNNFLFLCTLKVCTFRSFQDKRACKICFVLYTCKVLLVDGAIFNNWTLFSILKLHST